MKCNSLARINKQLLLSILIITVIVVSLSVFAKIAYIHTLLAISAWVFIGHFITLDDDMPGGWSNPDNQADIKKKSFLELLIKFLVFVGLLLLLLIFPDIENLGK